jgi:hypothetical protein
LPGGPWFISDTNGLFCRQDSVQCVSGGGQIVTAAGVVAGGGGGGSKAVPRVSVTRTDAEQLLSAQAAKGTGAIGAFVLRESTSVPNSFVLSVVLPDLRIEHLWLQCDGETVHYNGAIYPSLLSFVQQHQHQPFTLTSCPAHPFTLGVCLKGEHIYSSILI